MYATISDHGIKSYRKAHNDGVAIAECECGTDIHVYAADPEVRAERLRRRHHFHRRDIEKRERQTAR